MIHTFTLKIETADTVTEEEFKTVVAKKIGFNPSFGDTKGQYIKKHYSGLILKEFEEGTKEELYKTVEGAISNKLNGAKVVE